MKRAMFVLTCVVFIVLIYVGSTSDWMFAVEAKPKSCTGYEIIEAGKGIDCNGDTIKLTKRAGFYEVAANYPVTK
jgi:hypothetical protein